MAFKFDAGTTPGMHGEGGRGTIKEYFSPETWASTPEGVDKAKEILGEGFTDDYLDRNNAIDRLQTELFSTMIGLTGDEQVRVVWPEDGWYDEESVRKAVRRLHYARTKMKGLVLIGWQMDDPTMMLFEDGRPLAAFYASYRGMYQAGGFVHQRKNADGEWEVVDEEYFASDFAGEPHNTWIDGGGGCANVARSYLLKNRLF